MEPWLKRFAGSILLGLLTTILIAWAGGASMWDEFTHAEGTIRFEAQRNYGSVDISLESQSSWGGVYARIWYVDHPKLSTAIDFDWDDDTTTHWLRRLAMRTYFPPEEKDASIRYALGAGWPCIALWADTTDYEPPPYPGSGRRLIPGGLVIWDADRAYDPMVLGKADGESLRRSTPAVLPFYPYWPGLLKNTGLFAAPWFLAWLVIPAIRLARRRRRGACLHCGYDLQAGAFSSSPCPECGAVLASTPHT